MHKLLRKNSPECRKLRVWSWNFSSRLPHAPIFNVSPLMLKQSCVLACETCRQRCVCGLSRLMQTLFVDRDFFKGLSHQIHFHSAQLCWCGGRNLRDRYHNTPKLSARLDNTGSEWHIIYSGGMKWAFNVWTDVWTHTDPNTSKNQTSHDFEVHMFLKFIPKVSRSLCWHFIRVWENKEMDRMYNPICSTYSKHHVTDFKGGSCGLQNARHRLNWQLHHIQMTSFTLRRFIWFHSPRFQSNSEDTPA